MLRTLTERLTNRHRMLPCHSRHTTTTLLSIAVVSLLTQTLFCPTAKAESAFRPNIVLILTDDQGYGDVSVHGNDRLKTPNMDRIATEGARFERFFVEPVCAPTRAALLSGRYPTRTGVFGVTRNREIMGGDETTIAELLRDHAGYATGCFGKWHSGAHPPYHPNSQGFDQFIGFCGGHWNNYFDPILQHNGTPIKTNGFIADVLTDRAIKFIRREAIDKETSFFCYLPYNTPHTPASVPPNTWSKWHDNDQVEDAFTRGMYALCENIDTNLGRILATLDDLGISDNTVVVFLTDNGPNGVRFNDGMLGRKGSEHEGGVRVPLFVRWPGKIKPGQVIKPNVAHIDLLPTLATLAGITDLTGKTKSLDGIDISPLLLNGSDFELPKRNLFTWRHPGRWSVRSDRYRATAKTLHDLWEDPGQKIDVKKTHPDIHRELVAAYRVWESDAVPSTQLPASIHIGYENWKRVTIRAHELDVRPGIGKGINYSGPAGFANQWITQWTDPKSNADCPLKVMTAGRYNVTLRYACDPELVGSTFELSIGDALLSIPINEPWISAPRPAAEVAPKKPNSYLSILTLERLNWKQAITHFACEQRKWWVKSCPMSKPLCLNFNSEINLGCQTRPTSIELAKVGMAISASPSCRHCRTRY